MKHPTNRLVPLVLLGLLITTIATFGLPDHALAGDASAKDVGKNLGQLLKTWAGWLFGGVTALFAIPYLARRDIAGGLVFTGMAVIVGGFVLAGPIVADLIESMYKTVGTGG